MQSVDSVPPPVILLAAYGLAAVVSMYLKKRYDVSWNVPVIARDILLWSLLLGGAPAIPETFLRPSVPPGDSLFPDLAASYLRNLVRVLPVPMGVLLYCIPVFQFVVVAEAQLGGRTRLLTPFRRWFRLPAGSPDRSQPRAG